MNDLLGDPLPEIPPMTAALPWRVWQMNHCDWVMARTAAEAMAAYSEYVGTPIARLRGLGDVLDGCPQELSDADLTRLIFTDEDAAGEKVTRTFAEELARRVADVMLIPPRPIAELFASTEY